MVLVFPVMMAVAGVKEPLIAVRAAIGVLKQQMVKEPVFESVSSRSEELFAAAIGTPIGFIVGSGFVHRKNPLLECPVELAALVGSQFEGTDFVVQFLRFFLENSVLFPTFEF
jgi:hypothetical protein